MSATLSLGASQNVQRCRSIICEMVEMKKRRGLQLQQAWDAVAREIGLKPRRVRGYWHDEIVSVTADEKDQIEARRRAAIEAQLRQLDHEAAVLRARLQENRAA